MNIFFQSRYKSIDEFESPADMPEFIVLTGKNGSGKSHVLEAIKNNDLLVNDGGNVLQAQNIVQVPFGSLNVTGGDVYTSQQAQQACQQVWEHFNSWRQSYVNENVGGQITFLSYIQRFRNINDPNLENIHKAIAFTFEHEPDVELANITKRHFWKNIFDPETSTSGIDFFEQNFAKLFAEYQVSLIKQRFYKFMNDQGNEHAPSVNETELQHLEENKPWDFVNQVLRTAGFDFEVLPPDFWDTEEFDYHIRLRKKGSRAEVPFNELSTGEKTLFALALVRYKAEKRSSGFPSLVLIDEPDAPLHPHMTDSMLDVFTRVFVQQYHTKVIITTHSPATVALAPESSIFTVTASGRPNKVILAPATKKEALDVLASGFVAIADDANQAKLSFEVQQSRKPILFVEGETDKAIIETAWKKLKPSVNQPFSIIFCGNHDQIRQKIDATTVEELGDNNVVGLMDFDAAYNTFNGLKHGFSAVTGQESTCLSRTRQNNSKTIVAALLPVPAHRNLHASRQLGGSSRLTIELLFEDSVLTPGGNLLQESLPGGGSIAVFAGDKTRFANRTISRLQPQAFVHFQPLIDFLSDQYS